MDKPRPRHSAPRLPLIIERPDLAHPLRRGLGLAVTVFAWLVWLAMWIPFLAALGRYLGYDLPEIYIPSQISLHSFLSLVHILPTVIGVALGILAMSYVREKMKSGAAHPDERWRPVGAERLATGLALDPARLAAWQSAPILYVEHGPRGRVINASPQPPDQPSRPD